MSRETLALPAPRTAATATTVAATPPTSLAPGFRFHPTDEELVIYYLKRKVCGKSFRFDAVSQVDVYKSEPWDLADKSRLKTRDQEWYFFSPLDKKYGNGGRMNRATGKGYWKATGNDRPVRHDSRTVGLKKTLVFHSGRAPDGKRTNWVMHEYRLVDEEMEKAGIGSTQDVYVLCRVFHKNNIGPPNGQRYAPFIEEEWDDTSAMIPGAMAADEVIAVQGPCLKGNGHVACTEANNVVQDTRSINKATLDVNELPRETQNLLVVCKRESLDDYPSPHLDNPKPFSLIRYKRRRHNNSNSSQSTTSENSARPVEDPCSSTATTAATTLATMSNAATPKTGTKRNFLSALVEFSLLESLEPKGSPSVHPPELDAANLGSSVPPSCLKYLQNLQKEMHKISVEKETLKFEMMSAQAMIKILKSRIDLLNKENEDLRRIS